MNSETRRRGNRWWGAGLALVAAGWGANQFAPLIVAYRALLGLSHPDLNAMYGLYALGLVPALLAGGRLSDRFGRRRVVAPGLVLMLVATGTLVAGADRPALLFAGRLLTGVACGLVFSTGSAWIKEISADAAAGAGARRATVAITAGFALGPLAAGIIAQWAPAPTVWAYAPHAVLVLVALAALRAVAQPTPTAPILGPTLVGAAFPTRAFLTFFVPFAPWVFGTAAVFLAYLTPLVAPSAGAVAVLFSAVAAFVGAGAGILAQPLAAALDRVGGLVPGAMGLAVVGLLGAAWAAQAQSLVLVLVDSALLGAAYGVCQYCGLLAATRVATPATLGAVIGGYQVLSYVGFAFPYLLAVAQERWALAPSMLLTALAGVALVAGALATAASRRAPALAGSGPQARRG